ncbi:hypothetical protein [Haloprofundus salilacus]|uniref:hypothetical protein n=1 Tax=Haloprofundus salilacus TaxID=2876190 RepID=UPI001CC93CEB|nr:hypothetical protein [Haloprofundus salilacus]
MVGEQFVTGGVLFVAGAVILWVGHYIVFGDGDEQFTDARSKSATDERTARLAGGLSLFVGVVTVVYGVLAATSGLNAVLWAGYGMTVVLGSVGVAALAGFGRRY